MRYSAFSIGLKYLKYLCTASTKHQIHPPFAYDFVSKIPELGRELAYLDIEKQRCRLLKSKDILVYRDYGKRGELVERSVGEIAKNALKKKKYATLLAASATYFGYQSGLELGTCLGITTAYLAKNSGHITTIEGGEALMSEAQKVWKHLHISNIEGLVGNFDDLLPKIMGERSFDFVYIDGNHHKEATLNYFRLILASKKTPQCIIFDDIHWSTEMEEAWDEIKKHPNITLTFDFFFLGYAFINPNLTKQDFVIRY